MVTAAEPSACACAARPDWARVADDGPLSWVVSEIGEWEELRSCPDCGQPWLMTWPEELEGRAVLCRPRPPGARHLREIDRAETLRGYILARIEEHLGEIKEDKKRCAKQGCTRKCVRRSHFCLEHLIAERYGRQLSRIGRDDDEDLL